MKTWLIISVTIEDSFDKRAKHFQMQDLPVSVKQQHSVIAALSQEVGNSGYWSCKYSSTSVIQIEITCTNDL